MSEHNDFEVEEQPTRPRSRALTSTSRWRAVATAALERGVGRLSDDEFDEGKVPASESESESAPAPAPAPAPASGSAPTPEPTVVAAQDDPPVRVILAPRRDLGPRGTVRIVARGDLGPTGTVRIRARTVPSLAVVRARSKTRRWLSVCAAAAMCVIVGAASYRDDEPPAPGTQTAVAVQEQPGDPTSAPVEPSVMRDEPTEGFVATDPTRAAPLPAKRIMPRAAPTHKRASKGTVF